MHGQGIRYEKTRDREIDVEKDNMNSGLNGPFGSSSEACMTQTLRQIEQN